MKRKQLLITIGIVLFSFIIRLYRLDIPHEWSFDEVYHALSAEAYALNDPRGYEWWHAGPKDLAYEWLHPPLGKVFMALSIKAFAKPYIPESKDAPLTGDTTFAWRFPGTVFAALTVWLLIKFGTKLFNNFWVGAVAGSLYALDGLPFVQSRTGMNDIYVTFFVVLTFYRLYKFISEYSSVGPAAPVSHSSFRTVRDTVKNSIKSSALTQGNSSWVPQSRHPLNNYKNLFFLGLSAGLAAATKWSGFYAVGIAFVWGVVYVFKKRDWGTLPWAVICLGVIPPLVYVLSYGQWWLQGHTVKQFYELHQQIWWYQTGLKATHGYQSQAYTWPVLYRPVWYWVTYKDVVKDGVKTLNIGNIYAMGNPLVWWAGLGGIGYLVWRVLLAVWQKIEGVGKLGESEKSGKEVGSLPFMIVLVGYFGMFLPWVASPRIMFLYHYLPSVPFLCLSLAYGLGKIREIRGIGVIRVGRIRGDYIVTAYLSLVVVIFLYYYPHWSGLPLPESWVNAYYWLPSWK